MEIKNTNNLESDVGGFIFFFPILILQDLSKLELIQKSFADGVGRGIRGLWLGASYLSTNRLAHVALAEAQLALVEVSGQDRIVPMSRQKVLSEKPTPISCLYPEDFLFVSAVKPCIEPSIHYP